MQDLVCAAIHSRRLLAFEYDGLRRVVVPYCHGSSQGGKAVRAVQVRGESRSKGYGFGKLWMVARMRNVQVMDESFSASDPGYNPNDSAMITIHCRI